MKRLLHHPFVIKLLNWEYWSFHVLYAPVYPYLFLLGLRTRSFFFFTMSNPLINNGGLMMESKRAIYDLIPSNYYPTTLFFKSGTAIQEITSAILKSHLQFPFIAKPDIGMKGMSVKKINNESELIEYVNRSKVDFLIQEFVHFENEAGIYYYRYPGEARGHISGIVKKEFLTVKGDGSSSVLALLQKDKRCILQIPALKKIHGESLNKILNPNEEFVLVPYGNHARGTRFTDITHLTDEQLMHNVDTICTQVNGFYFGRLDIRYNTWEELKQGKNFSVIELNGAGSEPIHMYDPRHSIFFAWKEIFRHCTIMCRISRLNHKLLKRSYMKNSEGIQMFREHRKYLKLIRDVQY